MRPHPLFIFYDVRRWILLTFVPIIRFIVTDMPLNEWIRSVARDVSIAAALVAWASVRWATTSYHMGATLQIHRGVWIRRKRTLSPGSTALIATEMTPLMRIFRCRKIQISTADRRRTSDATLYVPKQIAASLIRDEIGTEGYHAKTLPVAVMALSGSNAAVGVLTLVPFIRRAATVLGDTFAVPWYELPTQWAWTELPMMLKTTANILLVGWGVAVTGTLLRTMGFRVHRYDGRLHIISGLFTKRSLQMDSGCISSLLLRQTLFTRLLGVYTATITCAGYGRETGVRPVLIPAATKRELCRALDRLLPQFPLGRVTVRPMRRALARYVIPPLLLLTAAGGAYLLSDVITPFPTVLVLIGGAWWFTVRLVGFFYAGIGITDSAVVMRYSRGLALYELHVPLASVDGIVRKQGPFQRKKGTCHVSLLCFGEKQRRHRIFGLETAAVNRLLETR